MRHMDLALEDMILSNLTLEGREFLNAQQRASHYLYVLVTDTKTRFSKISKLFTEQPYNHVSLMLEDSFNVVYTYALSNPSNGFKGGFKIETKDVLNGAHYSLYRVGVTKKAWTRVKERVEEIASKEEETRYNHRSLVNAIVKKPVFANKQDLRMICSEFVLAMLGEADIHIVEEDQRSLVTPYEIVRHKALQHVRRGVIKA